MSVSDFFAGQLRVTADQLIWAAGQIPEARRYLASDGHWSAAQIVFHLTNYERIAVLPSARRWDGGPVVDDSRLDRELDDWSITGRNMAWDDLIAEFEAVRSEQIALVSRMAGRWDESRFTPWTLNDAPPITLRWLVTKTLQHTFEHSDELLRMRLYWDMHDAWLKSSRSPRDP